MKMSCTIREVPQVLLALMGLFMLITLSAALLADLSVVSMVPVAYLASVILVLLSVTLIFWIILSALVLMAKRLWGLLLGATRITGLDGLGKPTTYGGGVCASSETSKMDATTWKPSGCRAFERNIDESSSTDGR